MLRLEKEQKNPVVCADANNGVFGYIYVFFGIYSGKILLANLQPLCYNRLDILEKCVFRKFQPGNKEDPSE